MPLRPALIFACAVLGVLTTGMGQVENRDDGNDLLPRCQAAIRSVETSRWRDADEAFDSGYCVGSVQGISYASQSVCSTRGVTNAQLARVVVKFLEDHPEKLNLNQNELVVTALSRAFPCAR